MAQEAVGGFFASLNLISDSKSFKKGINSLKDVEKRVKGLGSFALKSFTMAGGGLLAMASISASLDNQNMQVAKSLRMSVSELMQWKSAASIAGVSANGLTSALLDLQRKADRLKLGEVDIGLAKSLGFMGLNYQKFLRMNTGDKMKAVFSKALSMKDQGKAGELVKDILGDAGKEMYQYMLMTGQSLDSILAKSKALQFTNDRTRKGAMIFNSEMKATLGSFKEMGSLFLGTFGIEFTPILRGLQGLIIKNKQLIALNIIKFAKGVAGIAKFTFDVLKKGVPLIVTLVNKFGGLESVLKKVGLAFGIFYAAKTIYGISNLLRGLGALNTLKMGGFLVGFLALFLIIQDIATYMDPNNKGKTWTAGFLKWLDQVAEKSKVIGGIFDTFKTLGGLYKPEEISKMDPGFKKNFLIYKNAQKKAIEEYKKAHLNDSNPIEMYKYIHEQTKQYDPYSILFSNLWGNITGKKNEDTVKVEIEVKNPEAINNIKVNGKSYSTGNTSIANTGDRK